MPGFSQLLAAALFGVLTACTSAAPGTASGSASSNGGSGGAASSSAGGTIGGASTGSGATSTTGGPSIVDCGSSPAIAMFEDGGFSADWSFVRNQLVFNRLTPDGYYNLFVINPDGSGEYSPTYQNSLLPGKNVGCAVWSPGGDFIVFNAEKASHPGSSSEATCGLGTYQDLWAILPDGGAAWQLTDVPTDANDGTMIPRFAGVNDWIVWTQLTAAPDLFNPPQAFGYWNLEIAHFVVGDGGPSLEKTRTLQPLDGEPQGFYESGGFSPDGQRFLFTSSLATDNAWDSQIFSIDFDGGAVVQLTDAGYNEHPRFTPDGKTISWMSDYQATLKGTDWWLMDADGSNQRRLTYFNEPSNPESTGVLTIVGTVAWDPESSYFLGDLNYLLDYGTFRILKVSCP